MMIQYEADIARWVTAPPAVCDATLAMWVDWLTARLTSFLLDWRCTLMCALPHGKSWASQCRS